jgi:hypothetical protein
VPPSAVANANGTLVKRALGASVSPLTVISRYTEGPNASPVAPANVAAVIGDPALPSTTVKNPLRTATGLWDSLQPDGSALPDAALSTRRNDIA